jgi:hypothetical protein
VTVDIGEELNIVILRPSLAEGPTKIIQGLNALSRLFCEELSLKSRDTAIRSDASREVLRPKEGLRMTGLVMLLSVAGKPLAYL